MNQNYVPFIIQFFLYILNQKVHSKDGSTAIFGDGDSGVGSDVYLHSST